MRTHHKYYFKINIFLYKINLIRIKTKTFFQKLNTKHNIFFKKLQLKKSLQNSWPKL